MNTAKCDPPHTADNSWLLLDHNGVPITRYCNQCKAEKMKAYPLSRIHNVREDYQPEGESE